MGSGNSVPSVESGTIQSHMKVLEFFAYHYPFRKPLPDDASVEELQREDLLVYDLLCVFRCAVLATNPITFADRVASAPNTRGEGSARKVNYLAQGHDEVGVTDTPSRLALSSDGAKGIDVYDEDKPVDKTTGMRVPLTRQERRALLLPIMSTVHFTDALKCLANRVQELDAAACLPTASGRRATSFFSAMSSSTAATEVGPLGGPRPPLSVISSGGLSALLWDITSALCDVSNDSMSFLNVRGDADGDAASVRLYLAEHPPPVAALSIVARAGPTGPLNTTVEVTSSLEERLATLVHVATCASYFKGAWLSNPFNGAADTFTLSVAVAMSLVRPDILQLFSSVTERRATVTAVASLTSRVWVEMLNPDGAHPYHRQHSAGVDDDTRRTEQWTLVGIWACQLLVQEAGVPGRKIMSRERVVGVQNTSSAATPPITLQQAESLTYLLRLLKVLSPLLIAALTSLETSGVVSDAQYTDEQFEAAVSMIDALETLHGCGALAVLIDDDVRAELTTLERQTFTTLGVTGGEAAALRRQLVQLVGRTGCLLSTNEGAYRMASLAHYILSTADDSDTFASMDVYDMLLYLSRIATAPHAIAEVSRCLTCVLEEEWMREVENAANTDATASNIAPTAILSAFMNVGTHIATLESAYEVFRGVEVWLKSHSFVTEVALSSRDATWFAESVIRGISCARAEIEKHSLHPQKFAESDHNHQPIKEATRLEHCILRVLHLVTVKSGTLNANLAKACFEQDFFPEAIVHGLLHVVQDDDTATKWLEVVRQILLVVPAERCFAPQQLMMTSIVHQQHENEVVEDDLESQIIEEQRWAVIHEGVHAAMQSVLQVLDGCCTGTECAVVGCHVLRHLLSVPVLLVARPWNFFLRCDANMKLPSDGGPDVTATPLRSDVLHCFSRLAQFLSCSPASQQENSEAVAGVPKPSDVWVEAVEMFCASLTFATDAATGTHVAPSTVLCSCDRRSRAGPLLPIDVNELFTWSTLDASAFCEVLKQLIAIGLQSLPAALDALQHSSTRDDAATFRTVITSITLWTRAWTTMCRIAPDAAERTRRETAPSRWYKLLTCVLQCAITGSASAVCSSTPGNSSPTRATSRQARHSIAVERTARLFGEVALLLDMLLYRSFCVDAAKGERQETHGDVVDEVQQEECRSAETYEVLVPQRTFVSMLAKQHEGRLSPLRRHRKSRKSVVHIVGGDNRSEQGHLDGAPLMEMVSQFVVCGVEYDLFLQTAADVKECPCHNTATVLLRCITVCCTVGQPLCNHASNAADGVVNSGNDAATLREEFNSRPMTFALAATGRHGGLLGASCPGWTAAAVREMSLTFSEHLGRGGSVILDTSVPSLLLSGTTTTITDKCDDNVSVLRGITTAAVTTATSRMNTLMSSMTTATTAASSPLSKSHRALCYSTLNAVLRGVANAADAMTNAILLGVRALTQVDPHVPYHHPLSWESYVPQTFRLTILLVLSVIESGKHACNRSQARRSVPTENVREN